MSTPTPAEKALTDAVDTALQQYYEATMSHSVPAGWVLLVNDMGRADETSGIHIAYPNGSMPWAMAFGIVEMGKVTLASSFARLDDD